MSRPGSGSAVTTTPAVYARSGGTGSRSNDTYIATETDQNDGGGIVGTTLTNVAGNGFTVTYDRRACSALGGKTYTLSGGGVLRPAV